MSSAELSRGRGGPRCMSMPLVREDLSLKNEVKEDIEMYDVPTDGKDEEDEFNWQEFFNNN